MPERTMLLKRLSILLVILFLSACGDDVPAPSEADTGEDGTETAKVEKLSDEEIEKKETAAVEESDDSDESEDENTEADESTENDETDSDEDEKTESDNAEAESDSGEDTETEESEEDLAAEDTAVQEFTIEQQQEMNQLFYDWAVERAKIGGMAVTQTYFSHGAAGRGDWYAMTPDGEVQVQNQDNPGFDHFDIHALGGVAFYQPASGDFGEDENAPYPSTAEGYAKLALPETNIHKYMLADNGVVYELIDVKEYMSFSSGFGEYDDEGTYGEWPPGVMFEVSGDQDAEEEWQRILGMYRE